VAFANRDTHMVSRSAWVSLGLLVTLVIAVAGGYFTAWSNRPIVAFQLQPTLEHDYYSFLLPSSMMSFQFSAQNAGLTDITINVTITAIDALISAKQNDPFRTTVTFYIFLQAKSTWASFIFYVKPNPKASLFVISIVSVQGVDMSDPLTNFIVSRATFQASNRVQLTYVQDPNSPSTYDLYP